MGQVHEQCIGAGKKYAQVPESIDERLGAEGEPSHGSVSPAGIGTPHRFIDDVPPTGEIGVSDPVETGFLGDPQLRPAGGNGHCGLQGVVEGGAVEIDLTGHGVERRRLARRVAVRRHGGVGIDDDAPLGGFDAAVQLGLHVDRVVAPDQSAVGCSIEHFVDGTQVLADLVRLADHVIEKAKVGVGVADEVVHRHVAGLPVAVEPAVSLLQPRGVPGTVVVQQIAGGAMQVEALGRGVGGDQNAHLRTRVVERRLDVLPAGLVHAFGTAAAEQREHTVLRVPLPQAAGQVVEGGLVLGEDDQALAVPEPALGAQQPVHESHQGVEAGVGNGVLVGDGRAVEGETQARGGLFRCRGSPP